MWIDLSKWAKNVKILVSHVNAQKATSAEFSNQVDGVTRSVHSQPLFLAIPVIAQGAHGQNGHGGRDGGYAWSRQHGLSLTKAELVTTARSAKSRDHIEPQIWHGHSHIC